MRIILHEVLKVEQFGIKGWSYCTDNSEKNLMQKKEIQWAQIRQKQIKKWEKGNRIEDLQQGGEVIQINKHTQKAWNARIVQNQSYSDYFHEQISLRTDRNEHFDKGLDKEKVSIVKKNNKTQIFIQLRGGECGGSKLERKITAHQEEIANKGQHPGYFLGDFYQAQIASDEKLLFPNFQNPSLFT